MGKYSDNKVSDIREKHYSNDNKTALRVFLLIKQKSSCVTIEDMMSKKDFKSEKLFREKKILSKGIKGVWKLTDIIILFHEY